MDAFTSQLRAQLEKISGEAPPWGDVNPLVVIGLSEAILELNLTEDQLYRVIKDYGRRLAATVHPDSQQTNISGEKQIKILEAFDLLDDPTNFSKALAHFKTIRAEDRRESKILSQALSSLRKQLSGLESQAESLWLDKKKFAEERGEYDRLKKEDPVLAPGLEVKVANLHEALKKSQSQIKSEKNHRSEWKRKFEYAAAFIAGLGDPAPRGIIALDAKWVMVASLWHKDFERASPIKRLGIIRKDLISESEAVGIHKDRLEDGVKAWKVAKEQFGKPFAFETRKLPMGFSILKLEGGKETLVSGDRYFGNGRRIIGSIFPDKTTITRSQFRHRIPREIVIEIMSPLLAPGNLLVPVQTSQTRQTVPWSYFCPSFKFNTTALILAVG